jgi:hypothetical protein
VPPLSRVGVPRTCMHAPYIGNVPVHARCAMRRMGGAGDRPHVARGPPARPPDVAPRRAVPGMSDPLPWPVPASVCTSLRAAPRRLPRAGGHWRDSPERPSWTRQNRGDGGRLCHDFATLHPVRGLPMEAAVAYSGVPKRRPWALIQTGELPATLIPGMRAVLVLRDDLDRLLERYRTAAPEVTVSANGDGVPMGMSGWAVDNVWTTVGKSATRCRFGTAGVGGKSAACSRHDSKTVQVRPQALPTRTWPVQSDVRGRGGVRDAPHPIEGLWLPLGSPP